MLKNYSIDRSSIKYIVIFFLGGILLQYSIKLQSTQLVTEGQNQNKKFFHPYIQTFFQFFSYFLVYIYYKLIAYRVQKQQSENKQLQQQEKKNIYSIKIFILPTLLLISISILQNMALSLISPSTFSIFKGSTIFATLVFSKILLKIIIYRRHIISCSLAFIGLVIVGLSDFIFKDSIPKYNNQLIGYILLVFSLFINGFVDTYQKKLFLLYPINPTELVGNYAIIGFPLMILLIIVLSFIPCPFSVSHCVYNNQNQAFMENANVFLRQILQNPILILLTFTYMLAIILFSIFGSKITKLYDAITRDLFSFSKTIINWCIGIIITVSTSNQAYKLQSLDWKVILLKLCGYFFLILATLIYTKIIFKDYFYKSQQKKYLIQREQQ